MKAVTVVVEALTVGICGTDAEITSGGRVRVAVHVHVGERCRERLPAQPNELMCHLRADAFELMCQPSRAG